MKPVIIIEKTSVEEFENECENLVSEGYIIRKISRITGGPESGELTRYNAILTHKNAPVVLMEGENF